MLPEKTVSGRFGKRTQKMFKNSCLWQFCKGKSMRDLTNMSLFFLSFFNRDCKFLCFKMKIYGRSELLYFLIFIIIMCSLNVFCHIGVEFWKSSKNKKAKNKIYISKIAGQKSFQSNSGSTLIFTDPFIHHFLILYHFTNLTPSHCHLNLLLYHFLHFLDVFVYSPKLGFDLREKMAATTYYSIVYWVKYAQWVRLNCENLRRIFLLVSLLHLRTQKIRSFLKRYKARCFLPFLKQRREHNRFGLIFKFFPVKFQSPDKKLAIIKLSNFLKFPQKSSNHDKEAITSDSPFEVRTKASLYEYVLNRKDTDMYLWIFIHPFLHQLSGLPPHEGLFWNVDCQIDFNNGG